MQPKLLPIAILLATTALARAASPDRDYADALAALNKAQFPAAIQSLDKALAADPDNGQFLLARGVAKALNQNLPAATTDLNRASRILDGDWEPKGWIGVVNRMAGRFSEGFIPGLAPYKERDYAIAMNDLGQNYGMSSTHGTYYDNNLKQNVQTNTPYTGDFLPVAKMFVARHRAAGASDDTNEKTATGGGAGERPTNNTSNAQNAMLDRIHEEIAKHDYPAALEELAPLLQSNPDNPDLLLAQANALLALSDFIDSRPIYTHLLILQPQNAEAAANRAKAIAAVKSADDPHSLWQQLEQQSLAWHPGLNQQPLKETALKLLRASESNRKRYDEIYQQHLRALQDSLAAKPRDPARIASLGKFLFDESSILSEAVEPRSPQTYYRPYTPDSQQKEIAQATQLADIALSLDPQSVPALTLKANLELNAKNFDNAESLARRALAIKPNDPDLLELMAKLLQISAGRKTYAAGNLRSPSNYYETHFDMNPPMEYIWTFYPSKQDIADAEELERQAQSIDQLAEECIARASRAGQRTPLGYYYDGTLQRMHNNLDAAKTDMQKAVALDPQFDKAWFQLAGILTQLNQADEAARTRARAMNLSQTTAAPWLVAAWYKIPHSQLKSARDALTEAASLDPADPRIPAYLAILNEADDHHEAAISHWFMASALSDAKLQLSGKSLDTKSAVPLSPSDLALPTMIRLRLATLLLESNHTPQALLLLSTITNALNQLPSDAPNNPLTSAMLPNPQLPNGTVPLAESLTSLRTRVNSLISYTTWAVMNPDPSNAQLAAQTYRRMMIDYTLTAENPEALQAIADLGLAELYLHSGQTIQAKQAMKSTPAVPQDFWQEMRKVESAL